MIWLTRSFHVQNLTPTSEPFGGTFWLSVPLISFHFTSFSLSLSHPFTHKCTFSLSLSLSFPFFHVTGNSLLSLKCRQWCHSQMQFKVTCGVSMNSWHCLSLANLVLLCLSFSLFHFCLLNNNMFLEFRSGLSLDILLLFFCSSSSSYAKIQISHFIPFFGSYISLSLSLSLFLTHLSNWSEREVTIEHRESS